MKLFAITLLAAASASTSAAEPQLIPTAARLAATCAACHGTAGHTQGSTLPALAGQSQQALSASLHAFKTGKRDATIMTQIAKGYTDEQIELLAAYFAAQKKEAK
ncbi:MULTISPECIES: c-type cytochrome [unclassified Duganella]|uniref:c-type cytochrome n=1 Tax=unclassified Duganella TaxID=2636909 RepID=UPI00088BFAAD|nr:MULTISPECIES: c-type cytochrome [unclassified Duganella]SDH49537.1 Cytochrome c553 [Duganella sp. OV458]SDK63868.1 Cytochrome c553 [Duganella sp. OV510]